MEIEQFILTPIYKGDKCVGINISTKDGCDFDINNSVNNVEVYIKS